MPRAVGDRGTPRPDAFARDLLDAGLLVRGGPAGIYHRSQAFERVVSGITRLASSAAVDEDRTVLHLSPVQDLRGLESSGYVSTFPQLIGVVNGCEDVDVTLPALDAAVRSGREWTSLTEPLGLALCGAACHGVYPLLAGSDVPDDGVRYEVLAWCFRHEPDEDPARLQTFRMHEQVLVGSPAASIAHRERWLEAALHLLGSLGLDVDVAVGTDPFFGRAGRLLASSQRKRELKYEIVCPITSDARGAIASANLHEDHFGTVYGIRLPSGGPAHSACFGVGLERVALSLLRRHGLAVDTWPEEVRAHLGLDGPAGGSC